MPKVSIILPTYKDAPRMAKTIASVREQTVRDWELLVVDDGLTEAAQKNLQAIVAEDARITVIKNGKNAGVQESLNRGLAAASGIFIARIDDDDEWIDREKLAKQIAFLEINSEYVLVGTNAEIVDEKGAVLGIYRMPESDEAIRSRILSKNCFLHPTIVARKDAIEKAGGYDATEATKHVEDYDLWLKLGLLGKFANLPDIAARLTVHSQSMTAQNRIVQAKRMKNLMRAYRNKYPGFFSGYFLLSLRYLGFQVISILPIPKKLLYWIQNAYKKI